MIKLEKILLKAGYKLTKPRLAVLGFLAGSHLSISARDLYKKIRRFDLASIYRTLNLFQELHIVNVEFIDKEKIYCLADKPHHHIICTECGYIEKIECNHLFGNFKNFRDIHHQLTLTGVCNNCSS